MAKTLTISHEGKTYTLEFTRDTVRSMERNGFNINDISEKPMSTIPTIFAGAFVAHHPKLRRATIDMIFAAMPDKVGLLGKLGEMYSDPVDTLLDDPEDVDEGNASWGADW